MNNVTLLGNLGSDPELKSTAGGNAVTTVSLATNWRKKEGDDWVDQTEWHRLVAFGTTAETMSKHLSKGRKILVEGRLQTRSWETDSGEKRWMTEVVVNRFHFASAPPEARQDERRAGGGYRGGRTNQGSGRTQAEGYGDRQVDGDAPF